MRSAARVLIMMLMLVGVVTQPLLVLSASQSTVPIVELPTLAGGESVAYAINDAGQIVGRSKSAAGQDHAVLWEHGAIIDLGTFTGDLTDPYSSQALDINEAGQVVGPIATPSTNGDQAFIWQTAQSCLGRVWWSP